MKITRNIIMAAATIIAAASCTKESGSEYLNLSVNGYTFGWAGSDTLRVEVMTNAGEWTAEPDNPAIKAEKDGDEAVITMQPNETSEYVSGTVTFTAGGLTRELYVDQMPKSYDGLLRDFPLSGSVAMSPNGKYIAYMTQTLVEGDTYKFEPWLLDTETGELKLLEEPPYVGMGMTNYDGFRCISNDARYIVFENNGEAVNAMTIDGEVYDIKTPDGYVDAKIEAMSGDGSVWVGFVKMENVVGYYPCRWIDGEPEILDRPEFMIDGVTPVFAGTMARGCSDDGSIIYGSEWDNMLLVYWKDGQLVNIGQENGEIVSSGELIQASGLKSESQNTSISPDGRYVGCKYGIGGTNGAVPALVDTQTGRYQTMDFDGTVLTIGPDGTVFGASPSFGVSQGWVLDFDNNTSVALEDWLQQEHGITINGGRMITDVSSDGKVLLGYRMEVGAMGASYPYWFIRLEK